MKFTVIQCDPPPPPYRRHNELLFKVYEADAEGYPVMGTRVCNSPSRPLAQLIAAALEKAGVTHEELSVAAAAD